jgi:hypothetical protein
VAHSIQALIFDDALLPEANRLVPNCRTAALRQGFCLLPVTTQFTNELRGVYPEASDAQWPEFEYLSGPVESVALRLSALGPVAYVETDYHGGTGAQAAVAWHRGVVVLPPRMSEMGPINDALVTLGVARHGYFDEFEAVGLDLRRHL